MTVSSLKSTSSRIFGGGGGILVQLGEVVLRLVGSRVVVVSGAGVLSLRYQNITDLCTSW